MLSNKAKSLNALDNSVKGNAFTGGRDGHRRTPSRMGGS